MPQILVADVIVATVLQRYEIFLNYASFLAIIFAVKAFFIKLLSYNLLTFDICIFYFQRNGII